MILAVNYDLHQPGRDYEKVAAVMKTADGGWAHPQGSLWFLDTLQSPENWITRLRAAGDPNDEYLAARVQKNWWSVNLDAPVLAWLKDSRRRW